MQLKSYFSWIFSSHSHALWAVEVLSNKDEHAIISSLFLDNRQVAGIDTNDFTSVRIKHLKNGFYKVTVTTECCAWDESDWEGDAPPTISYSPHCFDGEYDLPALPTFEPDADSLTGFKSSKGEAFDWGSDSPEGE